MQRILLEGLGKMHIEPPTTVDADALFGFAFLESWNIEVELAPSKAWVRTPLAPLIPCRLGPPNPVARARLLHVCTEAGSNGVMPCGTAGKHQAAAKAVKAAHRDGVCRNMQSQSERAHSYNTRRDC